MRLTTLLNVFNHQKNEHQLLRCQMCLCLFLFTYYPVFICQQMPAKKIWSVHLCLHKQTLTRVSTCSKLTNLINLQTENNFFLDKPFSNQSSSIHQKTIDTFVTFFTKNLLVMSIKKEKASLYFYSVLHWSLTWKKVTYLRIFFINTRN